MDQLSLFQGDYLDAMPDADRAAILTAREVLAKFINANPVISSWGALQDYLRTAFAGASVEAARILYLDNRNRLIRDEECGRGTVNHVPLYPREIIKRALELGAAAIIVAHNHPSGDATPSQADIDMSKQLGEAGAILGITLHDSVVVGSDRVESLRSLGHI